MPTLITGNTVYTYPVAKVMISIPDDLLERLDAQARATQETRSGFLRRLAEEELGQADDAWQAEVTRLLDLATQPMGGEAARIIREARDSR